MPEILHWSALEHEDRERGPYWFLGPGAAALTLVIFGVFAQSYFFIVFVVLAYILILVSAHRPPRKLEFQIGPDGIRAGATRYPYAELKSFWIFDTPERHELSLETSALLTPFLHIPLGDTDPDLVGRTVTRFLPEEEHRDFISDQIARKFGF